MEVVRPAEVGHMVPGPHGFKRFIIDHVLEPDPTIQDAGITALGGVITSRPGDGRRRVHGGFEVRV